MVMAKLWQWLSSKGVGAYHSTVSMHHGEANRSCQAGLVSNIDSIVTFAFDTQIHVSPLPLAPSPPYMAPNSHLLRLQWQSKLLEEVRSPSKSVLHDIHHGVRVLDRLWTVVRERTRFPWRVLVLYLASISFDYTLVVSFMKVPSYSFLLLRKMISIWHHITHTPIIFAVKLEKKCT